MSWRATAAVKAIRTEVTRSEKLLLFILADYHNDETNQCDPSIKRLAADALMSRRTAQIALGRLHEKRMVFVEEREEGGQTSNQYWLACAGVELPDRLDWAVARRGGGAKTAPPIDDKGGDLEITPPAQPGDRTPRDLEIAPPAQELQRTGGDPRDALTVIEPQREPKIEPQTQPKGVDAFGAPPDGGSGGDELARPAALTDRAFEQSVMAYVAGRLTRQNFETWLGRCGVIRQGATLLFVTPNALVADWISNRFRSILAQAATHFDCERFDVRVAA